VSTCRPIAIGIVIPLGSAWWDIWEYLLCAHTHSNPHWNMHVFVVKFFFLLLLDFSLVNKDFQKVLLSCCERSFCKDRSRTLWRSHCPINEKQNVYVLGLLHGFEACALTMSDLQSLDSVINGFLMKLFATKSIETAKYINSKLILFFLCPAHYGQNTYSFITAPTLLNLGQPNFARCLAVSWAATL